MAENDLQKLRLQIRETDESILKLVARRMELARQVAEAKLAQNLPVKDYQVEKQVIEHSRARARELKIYEDLAEEISKSLIKFSCLFQDEYQGRSRRRPSASKRKILVVGGLGPMGQWFAGFFDSFGHAVELQDVAAGKSEFPLHRELADPARKAEIIVLATPISVTAGLIAELAKLKTSAVVFDICSLKSPLLSAIRQAQKAGLRITSVHPMFGPKVDLLSGRNILLCESGDKTITDSVAELFQESTANLMRLPLDRHDEYIGFILGLSHITNLTFASALADSGLSYRELGGIGSTTFNAQAEVADAVVQENADLYFEIQAENQFSPAVLQKYRETFEAYAKAIQGRDRDGFKRRMETSKKYFQR